MYVYNYFLNGVFNFSLEKLSSIFAWEIVTFGPEKCDLLTWYLPVIPFKETVSVILSYNHWKRAILDLQWYPLSNQAWIRY